MNLRQMLGESARQYKEKTAVALGDTRLSYTELDKASNRIANVLLERGVGRGDRIAMLLSNSLEFVTTYLGIVKAGGMAVPLDTKYKLDELASLYNDSRPKVLVAESPLLKSVVPVLAEWDSIEWVIDVGTAYRGRFIGYQEIMAASPARPVAGELEPGDIAHIAYTSGPSFHPRGAMLSHQALVREAAISGDGFQQTDRDIVVLFALPMYHAFGLIVVLLTALARGSTVIILPGLSIKNLMEVIERERATIFMAVPFVHALIVNAVEAEGLKHDISSLRLWGTAGAAMPASISQRLRRYLGMPEVNFWGMTESSAHVTCQPLDGTGKPGSVGKPLPGWDLKIVDDNDRELPSGEVGEIIVRGPIMEGYYNNPRATAEIVKDNWLYTGDMGWLDKESQLFLSEGRKKDVIISKGQNIYPGDIEQVLAAHPKVAGVAVAGIYDEMRGEVPRAVIRLKAGEVATEQEMKRFCLGHLANYKVPREVVFAGSLPGAADSRIRKEDLK